MKRSQREQRAARGASSETGRGNGKISAMFGPKIAPLLIYLSALQFACLAPAQAALGPSLQAESGEFRSLFLSLWLESRAEALAKFSKQGGDSFLARALPTESLISAREQRSRAEPTAATKSQALIRDIINGPHLGHLYPLSRVSRVAALSLKLLPLV